MAKFYFKKWPSFTLRNGGIAKKIGVTGQNDEKRWDVLHDSYFSEKTLSAFSSRPALAGICMSV